MPTASQLQNWGWTPEKLRERLQGCRDGLREAKARGGSAVWTYRFLFVSLYLKHKQMLRIMEKSKP